MHHRQSNDLIGVYPVEKREGETTNKTPPDGVTDYGPALGNQSNVLKSMLYLVQKICTQSGGLKFIVTGSVKQLLFSRQEEPQTIVHKLPRISASASNASLEDKVPALYAS